MKAPVLLSVAGEAADFAGLIAAAQERKLRIGWLEIDPEALPAGICATPPLSDAYRVVTAGAAGNLSWKRRSGPPVLRDLLREHFLGADVVLVRGLDLHPQLIRDGDAWRILERADRGRPLSGEQLFARLRQPDLRWRDREPGGTLA